MRLCFLTPYRQVHCLGTATWVAMAMGAAAEALRLPQHVCQTIATAKMVILRLTWRKETQGTVTPKSICASKIEDARIPK